jgi:hypothetical protein
MDVHGLSGSLSVDLSALSTRRMRRGLDPPARCALLVSASNEAGASESAPSTFLAPLPTPSDVRVEVAVALVPHDPPHEEVSEDEEANEEEMGAAVGAGTLSASECRAAQPWWRVRLSWHPPVCYPPSVARFMRVRMRGYLGEQPSRINRRLDQDWAALSACGKLGDDTPVREQLAP